MNNEMSNDEKKRLSYERQNAVRQAWKAEKARVSEGYGTRKWSSEEQEELLNRGSVRGYEGHHMKSVSLYPKYAGDANNIQFLNEEEHLRGAHKGSYHNLTNGYYDPETKSMNEFGDELGKLPVYDLGTYERIETIDDVRTEYYEDIDNKSSIQDKMDVQEIKGSLDNTGAGFSSGNESQAAEGMGMSNGRR